MPLHRLTEITVGVPHLAEAAAYYAEFGLTPVTSADDEACLATVEGGRQLRLVPQRRRGLRTLGIGVDDRDDLDRVASSLAAIDVPARRDDTALRTHDPVTGLEVVVSIAPRVTQAPTPAPAFNTPGDPSRPNRRADAIDRVAPVRPRKLGHVVFGSTDQAATQRFFTDGLGFKVSDQAPGLAAFLRCSTDHHNVLVQQAPVDFLHHTSWEVDDVDEVGRGASAMLEEHPERHTWGLGRHHIGSNFFWYLRDPAGNFSEYYSDIDTILDDQLWEPGVIADAKKSLYSWGPPPPPSFLAPDDLAELMADSHDG